MEVLGSTTAWGLGAAAVAFSLLANTLAPATSVATPTPGEWIAVAEIPVGAGPGRIAYDLHAGEPQGPDSFAVDRSDTVYVLDGVEHAIEVLQQGRHLRTIDLSFTTDPRDLALAPDGTLYVLDTGQDPIAVFHLQADGYLIGAEYFAAGVDLAGVNGLTIDGEGGVWIRIGGSAQVALAAAGVGLTRQTPGQTAPGGRRPVVMRQIGSQVQMEAGGQPILLSFYGKFGAAQLLGEDGDGALHVEAVDLVDGPAAAGEVTVRRYSRRGDLLGVLRFNPPEWGYVPRTRFLSLGGDGQVYALLPGQQSVQVRRATYGRAYTSDFAELQERATPELRPDASGSDAPGPAAPAESGPRPITVAEAVRRAHEMIHLYWYFRPGNRTPTTRTLRPPDWLATSGAGWKRGIPYNWGGLDSPDTSSQPQLWPQFMAAAGQGRFAGNVESSTCCYQPGTAGLDCSGFVTAVWRYPYKLGTYALRDDRNVTRVITLSEFGPMDAAVTYGHALLYSWRDASGLHTAESTTANQDRAQNSYLTWSFMAMRGYAFRRYVHMISEPPRRCGGKAGRPCRNSGGGSVLPR